MEGFIFDLELPSEMVPLGRAPAGRGSGDGRFYPNGGGKPNTSRNIMNRRTLTIFHLLT